MNLDRTIAPPTKLVSEVKFSFPGEFRMGNGSPVYFYHDEESEVLRLELLFPAGSRFSAKRLQAGFTNKLITSGTERWSAREISEKFDYFGAHVDKQSSPDYASLRLFCLRKYAPELLELLSEVLREASFPDTEFELLRKIRKQKFRVSMEKVNFLAKKEFTHRLFGESHAYGGRTEPEDFDLLSRTDVLEFFRNNYQQAPLLMAAGRVDEELLRSVDRRFGKLPVKEVGALEEKEIGLPQPEHFVKEKPDAVQSAMRIGRRLFNRNHKDYPEMTVLTTLLGGYFGSRLMSNLREDKGYTYGVGAGIASFQLDGYLFISTQVGADVTKLAEQEILFELKKLRENPIPERELDTVKRYLMGEILHGSDGVFANMDRFKMMWLHNQPESRFKEVVERMKAVSPEKLRDLANTYLKEQDLTTVIVGKY